jgi:hypothetical protein
MSSTPNPANPADLNKTAVEKLKAAILAKRKADEALVSFTSHLVVGWIAPEPRFFLSSPGIDRTIHRSL